MKINEIAKFNFNRKKDAFNNVDKRLKFGIVGVGGGGSNAVIHASKNLSSISSFIEFLVINTDIQALKKPGIENIKRMLIGEETTSGLGSGGRFEVGQKAAKESVEKIRDFVKGKSVIFLSLGLGGGTGSGAGPVVAQIAKEEGVLVIAFGTFPFKFEGKERYRNALKSNSELNKFVDSLILFDNESFLTENKVGSNESLSALFKEVNNNFIKAIVTLIDLIYDSSLVNVDFNDVKTTLLNSGSAVFNSLTFTNISVNDADTERNIKTIREDFETNFNSRLSLLNREGLKKATNIILNISGPEEILKMNLVREIISNLSQVTNEDVDYIFGVSYNEYLKDKIKISYLIVGLEDPLKKEFEEEKAKVASKK